MKLGAMEIDLSTEWEDRSMYTFIAPPRTASRGLTVKGPAEFRTNVVITPAPLKEGADLSSCAKELEQRVRRDFGAELEITSEEGPTASGLPTRRMSWRVTDPRGGAPIQQIAYVLAGPATEWTITFSTLALEAKRMLPDFDDRVRSIRLATAERVKE